MKKYITLFILLAGLFPSAFLFGQSASITWPLTSTPNPATPVGNIQGSPEALGAGPAPAMSIFNPYSNGQRLWVGNTGWIAGPLDVTRYIQFDATPLPGNSFTVTNVSFNYGDDPRAVDVNTLAFQAYYSTDNWANSAVLNSTPFVYLNTVMSAFTQSVNVPVANGQTFSLRIYPYALQNSSPMSPTFAIHNTVVIDGVTAPTTLEPFCTTFEDGTTGGWQVNNALQSVLTDGSEHYIQTTDMSGSSYFFNESAAYTGDWGGLMTDSCGSLCFDINYLYNGDPYNGVNPPLTMTPVISIAGNGFTASFITSAPITTGDGWHSYCAPLRYLHSDGTMPSNMNGHWVMGVGTPADWNSLLSNVTRVTLPVDPTGHQNERIGYDNICIRNSGDCNAPGSMCGVKFNDLNGNGMQDAGEPGLPGWEISLNIATMPPVLTDSLGNYCFNNLPAGAYTVTETPQAGWQQTFPASPGTHTIDLAAGEQIDSLNFGNQVSPVGTLCDSLRATATRVTPGDCVWSLSLYQPANLSGISSIRIAALLPNQFTTGTALGTNYQTWFTTGSNTFTPPNGIVPGGALADFFTMSLSYVTSPQIIVVTWLDAADSVICSDTVQLDCQTPCVSVISDTVTCVATGGYTLAYAFTNNATYGIAAVHYTVQNPLTVTIAAPVATLSPAVASGSNSNVQTIHLSGAVPGDVVSIVAKFMSPDSCCWCYDTLTAIIPTCDTVCDSVSVQVAGSPTDCCYAVSLMNTSSTVFSKIEFALLSGGMYSTISTTSAPGWGFTNIFPNNLITLVKFPIAQGIGQGSFSNALNLCVRQYASPTQTIEVRWVKDGVVICRDTLQFECVTPSVPTDSCSQIINDTLLCLPDGTLQYNFQVQNNSNIPSTGYGIHPTTPGVSFSRTLMQNVSIMPGQVSPMDSIIISGVADGQPLCFQTAIFNTIVPGDTVYNYCCHSDTICIPTPVCDGDMGSLCGTKFNDLNGNGVQDAGEAGLANWQISLNVATMPPALTDSLGNYCFENVPAGTYTVTEIHQSGWQQTSPILPGSYTVVLTAGEHVDSLNFGNQQFSPQHDTCSYLCNTDFEDQQVVAVGSQDFFDQDSVPCWHTTTSDHIIEVWGNGFQSVPSYSGNQFIELNAHMVGTLYQTFNSGSGGVVTIGFAHRGRVGFTNSMSVSIEPISGTPTILGTYTGSVTAWTVQSVQHTLLANTTYVLSFISLPVGGTSAGGNFLDAISITCPASICGVKYNDLNGNGQQDGDEPGLPEWQINLTGAATLSTKTNGKGEFCFNNLLPGQYTVVEVMQAGWQQTAPPPPGAYDVTLTSGQHIEGIDFGNMLDAASGCINPPDGMVAWWPFDEVDDSAPVDLAGFNNSGVRANGAAPTPAYVLGGVRFDGVDDYVEVPDHAELNFGTGDLSFDAWIRTSDNTGAVDLVDKRTSASDIRGYSFFLINGNLSLQLCDGTFTSYGSPVFVADGKWHHIAVTVARADPKGILFYLDGVATQFGDPTLHPGSLDNKGPLRIGSQSFSVDYLFRGVLDEIELFDRVLTEAEVFSLFAADSAGKCKPDGLLGSLCGSKYNDLNGNGVRDHDEPGLPKWQINIGGPVDLFVVTDENGDYCFADLPSGVYTIKEELQPGWLQTAPPAGHFVVALGVGQNVDSLDFGNRLDSCLFGTKAWTPLGKGMNRMVSALAVMGTDLYAGGWFTSAGGASANYIAKWDGTSWSPLGSGMNGNVYALAVIGTDLYAGGNFTTAGGVAAEHIAKWDGTAWSSVGTGMNSNVFALAVIGTDLYAGGEFILAGGISANNIAKWNGSWSALGAGTNNSVRALAVNGTVLFAGGQFTTAGGVSANHVAKWNGSWSAPATGVNDDVMALAVIGGDLYAGGNLTAAGGTPVSRIAKWNASNWSALGSGVSSDVHAFGVMGTDLYVAGALTIAGGTPASRIAKWNGSGWSALGSGVNSSVGALAVIGTDLYAGGVFTLAGGTSANYIAKYSCSLLTSVEEDKTDNSVGRDFQLEQNYPNPFNPSTMIEYSLQHAALVSLRVYTLLGFEVATLVNSRQEAGSYTVSFNTNDGIHSLPSGIYFYRLTVGSSILIKKLTLMK